MKITKQSLLTILVTIASTTCITLFFAGSPKPLPKVDFKEITTQECEYIFVDEMYGAPRIYSITHKGNCKNSIHQCK